jgi:hypothetical protein
MLEASIKYSYQHVGYSTDLARLQQTACRWGFVILGQISTNVFTPFSRQRWVGAPRQETVLIVSDMSTGCHSQAGLVGMLRMKSVHLPVSHNIAGRRAGKCLRGKLLNSIDCASQVYRQEK